MSPLQLFWLLFGYALGAGALALWLDRWLRKARAARRRRRHLDRLALESRRIDRTFQSAATMRALRGQEVYGPNAGKPPLPYDEAAR